MLKLTSPMTTNSCVENKVLKQMLVRHRVFEKLEHLQQNKEHFSPAIFQLRFNKWDVEVTEMILASEKKCNKFMDGSIEWSPEIGIWINRMRAYRAIERFKEGRINRIQGTVVDIRPL